MLDTDDYRARAITELQGTHLLQTDADEDPLTATRAELKAELLPRIGNLPRYAQEWVTGQLNSNGEVKKTKPGFIEQNPKTGEEYTLPLFRLTIKVHKTPPEGRPVTANHNWITQPLAELVAHLL